MHPEKLSQALHQCETLKTGDWCDQLNLVAKKIRALAWDLQQDPQAFGQQILMLQEKLAKAELALKQSPNEPALKVVINDHQHALAEHLAIVKWLESP